MLLRTVTIGCALAVILLASMEGCEAPPDSNESSAVNAPHESAAEPSATPVSEPEPTSFGTPSVDELPEVAMPALLADGAKFAGQRVRTSGKVVRVCQRMGCWLELQDAGAGNLRVPMAGHAFFVPQSLVGRRAVVEGEVILRPLTDAQKAHYRAEGMEATSQAVSLDATSVQVASK